MVRGWFAMVWAMWPRELRALSAVDVEGRGVVAMGCSLTVYEVGQVQHGKTIKTTI